MVVANGYPTLCHLLLEHLDQGPVYGKAGSALLEHLEADVGGGFGGRGWSIV